MTPKFAKRDRTARLLRVEHLLSQHPHGLTAREVAGRIGVNVRTAYRDIKALEDELGFPLWEDKGRFGALPSACLPPLNLTLPEAVSLLLSARVMARFEDRRDDNVIHAFGSLAGVLPAPIAQHVYATLTTLNQRPRDKHFDDVFEVLVKAWAERKKVRIGYAHWDTSGQQSASERVLSPYFIEPHPAGHSLYVLAHDSLSGGIRTFKVERIRSAELTAEEFEVPAAFDIAARLKDSWIVTDEEPVEVRVRFHDRSAAERAKENRWHTSQKETERDDGKLELQFRVAGLTEIQSWVLGWGDAIEVIEPPELRARTAAITRSMAARYL